MCTRGACHKQFWKFRLDASRATFQKPILIWPPIRKIILTPLILVEEVTTLVLEVVYYNLADIYSFPRDLNEG